MTYTQFDEGGRHATPGPGSRDDADDGRGIDADPGPRINPFCSEGPTGSRVLLPPQGWRSPRPFVRCERDRTA